MADRWMLVSQAAEVLGVSESTVRRRAGRGSLPSRRNSDDVLQVKVHVQADAPSSTHASGSAADSGPAARKVKPKEKLPTSEPVVTPKPIEEFKVKATPANEPKRLLANKAWAHLASSNPGKIDDLSLESVKPQEASPSVSAAEQPADAVKTLRNQAADSAPTQVFPNLTLADIAPPADGAEESELRKFQRLAGASLVVAQRQVDEANEKLAIVRSELHRARTFLQGSMAAAIVLALLFTVSWFGGGGNAQPAHAESVITPEQLEQQQLVEAAQAAELAEARATLQQMQQQLNNTLQRLDAADAE